jgi:hypothetical protein
MSELNEEDLKAKSLILKEEGNKLLSNNRYAAAAQKYLQAIEIFPDPIYYANRAHGINFLVKFKFVLTCSIYL